MIENKQEISKDLEKAKRKETQSQKTPQAHHGRYYREVFSQMLPL